MAIQSRYRSQAAALSRAIRMLLMVMLRSGRKGRQGTYRDQAQGNRVMPSPRGTHQPMHRGFTAHLGSLLLWLVADRQGEAQPSHRAVRLGDLSWDCSLCWRGMLVEGGLVDRSCTGAGGTAGFKGEALNH